MKKPPLDMLLGVVGLALALVGLYGLIGLSATLLVAGVAILAFAILM